MKIALTLPGMNGTPVDTPPGVPTGGLNNTGTSVIVVAIDLLILGAILFSLYQILTGGMSLAMSRGNKEILKKTREKVVFAVFGLIITLLVIVAINALSSFVGTPLLPFLHKY
jgi:uncharacterized protein YacL